MELVKKYQDRGAAAGAASGVGAAMQGFGQGGVYGMIAQGVGGIANKFPTPNADLNSNNQATAAARGAISDALLTTGNPYAMAAGAAIKIIDKTGGFSNASKGLGGGTDVANAVASIVLPGAGWFAPKTDKYKISADMQAMSSGYAGAMENNSTAQQNAGAKILFGRGKANAMISNAKQKDLAIQGIKQQSDNDYQAMASMTQNKAMSNAYQLGGGYNQSYARAGKFGMRIERVKELSIKFKTPEEIKTEEVYVMKDGGKFFEDLFIPTSEQQNNDFFANLFKEELPVMQKGGKIKEKNEETYREFLATLPNNLQEGNDGEDGYRMRYLFNNSPNVWNFSDAVKEGLFELDPDDKTYHGFSVFAPTGEFLKSRNHPTIIKELEWYNGDSEDAKKFREEYDLVTEEEGKPLTYYKYKRKVESHKEGGQMNVIPEGSLHARLHHMANAENLTKKGIPVVDKEGNQQAEIEHSEIIFQLSVTQKLEELCKKYNSDDYTAKEKENFAIEAGKLLSTEIMENTDDRVGLLNNLSNEQTQSNN